MISPFWNDVLWCLALIGAVTVVVLIHYVCSGQMAAESAARRKPQPQVRPAPTPAPTEAQVVQEHRQVAEHYERLIGELYDFDDRAFGQPGQQP